MRVCLIIQCPRCGARARACSWTCRHASHARKHATARARRFSSDTSTVDDSLPFILNILLANTVSLAGLLAVMCFACPPLLALLLPLALAYRQGCADARMWHMHAYPQTHPLRLARMCLRREPEPQAEDASSAFARITWCSYPWVKRLLHA